MKTADIYTEMYRLNLTDSMRRWSQDWAGRSHNFASINWEQPLPVDTAIRLRRRLLAEGHPDLAAKVLLAMLEMDPMPHDPFSAPEPFSLDDIISKCCGGSLPAGWLDAYGAYLHQSHARAAAEIAAIFAEAEGDPAALARLNDAQF